MKLLHFFIVASAALGVPAVSLAQPAPAAAPATSLAVGATIYDPQGGEVGKIESMTADAVVVDTGANKATLPRTAFGTGPKGPTITLTKAQIDEQVAAATQKAAAALDAALVAGAEVKGKAGAVVGTVKEVAGDQVVIDRAAGPVALGKSAFILGTGGLVIPMTAEELDAAAKQASSAS